MPRLELLAEEVRRPEPAPARAPASPAPAPTRPWSRIPVWLPDAITLARIALMPLFLLAAEATHAAVAGGAPLVLGGSRALLVALFVAIGASDKLDGFLARRSGRPTTRRGALLDAGADRLVQWSGTGYFALRASPAFTPLPLWLPVLLVLRDTTLFGVWLGRARAKTVSVEHELHGKAATTAVFALVLAATAGAPAALVEGGALLVATLALYSTARYALRTRRQGPTREENDG